MNNPGVYTLAALGNVTAALAAQVQTPITGLDGMTAVTLDADFKYGSGGGTFVAKARTSFDGGTTWRDIAQFNFTTASAAKNCNLEGMLSKGITIYADLAAEGVYDGVLGSMLDAVITSTGTYAGTSFSLRASVR